MQHLYLQWEFVHGVYKFCCSIGLCRSLAFGHRLWVYQWGLFFCKHSWGLVLAWVVQPTRKPCRHIDTPMCTGVCVCVCVLQRKRAMSITCKTVLLSTCSCEYYCNAQCCMSVWVCLSEWCLCRGAGARSEWAKLELNLRHPAVSHWVGAGECEGTTLALSLFRWSGETRSDSVIQKRQQWFLLG